MPTERPILFSAPMVRAILDGTKTQTRRVVKELPGGRGGPVGDHVKWWEPGNQDTTRWCGHDGLGSLGWLKCPYGIPGDRLWLRETFCPRSNGQLMLERVQRPFYRADSTQSKPPGWRWHPSIHMPRKFSRITLSVTGVRVERVQDISEEDARAEGVSEPAKTVGGTRSPHMHKRLFASLWDSINGKKPGCSWDDNPWVWVVEFKRVEFKRVEET